ncbi:MAG: sulfite exporter TauE/SafE family protein [Gemmatimonadota bacterium]|nr:sulfite exporter TauE/SafE family protein [Gemmatimonadota bacterium]
MTAKDVLLLALAVVALGYLGVLFAALRGSPASPTLLGTATGFVTNFFDTLGIGSFAPTTSIFRQFKMVRDERIPGTLNVGHTLPTVVQAFIFTKIVPVDSLTLISMIAAAIAGAWLGAGVVSHWPRQRVQVGMGLCLLAAATIMTLSLLNVVPGGGVALGLDGPKLVIAIAVNFLLGALMTLGIGLYAPCLILISLLGMSPKTAFPIMMGSCAFLMPVASVRFIRERKFDTRVSLGLLLGGLPAVLIAAYAVKSLPLDFVRGLVIVVVVYTAANLLRAAHRERGGSPADGEPGTATL